MSVSDFTSSQDHEMLDSFATNGRVGAGDLVWQISSADRTILVSVHRDYIEHDNNKFHSPVRIPCRCSIV